MSSTTPSRLFWALDAATSRKKQEELRQAHSLKLIDVSKGKLILAKAGLDLLRSQSPTQNLNLVFVFGNARSGKSFLMNCLSGVPGLFQVLNSAQPCTKGVDISSQVMPYEMLQKHAKSLPVSIDDIDLQNQNAIDAPPPSSKRSSDTLPNVGWVDVEGQGAEDNSYDTMLALPLLLTSKTILFNHKGAPTVSDMLSRLGVLARAAEYIDIGDDDDPESTEGDDSAPTSKPSFASQRVANGTKKFGHLHVIFRDFSFEGDAASVFQQLLGLENVQPTKSTPSKHATKNFNGTVVKSDRDRENEALKAIQERNDIRNLLHENFQSIHVWLLKQPASADDLKQHKELPENLVDPAFTHEIQRLSVVLTEQLRTPTLFAGSYLNGVKVCTLLQQITQSLNTNGAISVPSVFKSMEGAEIERVYREMVAEYEKRLAKVRPTLPLSKATLNAHLAIAASHALETYDEALAECVLVEERTKKREELVALTTRSKEALLATNQEMLLVLLRKTVSESTTVTKVAFETFCTKVIPIIESRVLEQEFATLKAKHVASIKSALSAFPEAQDLAEYKFALLESEETLTEYLSFQLVRNDSVVKDDRIARLQEEAIAQQALLIEQNKRLEEYLASEKAATQKMEAELERLRQEQQNSKSKSSEEQARYTQMARELEALRKKKKNCVIL